MKLLGLVLFLAGLGLLGFLYLPVLVQEIRYDLPHEAPAETFAETPQAVIALKKQDPEMQKTVLVPASFDFSIVIPQIGVNSVVFPNIDSGDPAIYLPILKQGVAHALGSSLPNQAGPVFVFAHSTDTFFNVSRYNATFFLLGKLKGGEDAYIFYKNRKYHYRVTGSEVVEAADIPYVVNSHLDDNLILQTCYPPGTTLKRLLVFAKLTE